jgi:hypothetical protein
MIICPHCKRQFDDDDMYHQDIDVYCLAPKEERGEVDCPGCRNKFIVVGSYKPIYESYKSEDEID